MAKSKKKRAGKKKAAAASKAEAAEAKQGQRKPSTQQAAALSSTYATYKRSTESVKQWCEDLVGKGSTSTLTAWRNAMLSIARDGTSMPEAVAKELGMAIFFRAQCNEFYASIQTCYSEKHANHVYVCELLRSFRRLFKRGIQRKAKALGPEQPKAPSGFSVLAHTAEESDSEEEQENVLAGAQEEETEEANTELIAHEEEDEEMFAVICLLTDMIEAAKTIKDMWTDGVPSTAPRECALLGLACSTTFRTKMMAQVINSTSVCFPSFDLTLLNKICKSFVKCCAQCSTVLGAAKRCTRCKSVAYCSKQCQKAHWKTHKRECQPADVNISDVQATGSEGTVPKATLAEGSLDTIVKLTKIMDALLSFDPASVPRYINSFRTNSEGDVGRLELTPDASRLSVAALTTCPDPQGSTFDELLRAYVSTHLPLWISHTDLPISGALDSIIRTYLREFRRTKKPTIELSFIILVVLENTSVGFDGAADVISATLGDQLATGDWEQFEVNTDIDKLHIIERAKAELRHIGQSQYHFLFNLEQQSPIYSLCPWFGGEIMLIGLRLALAPGIKLVHHDIQGFQRDVHMYWLLRSLGFLHAVPEIDLMFACYRKQVFFRGGMPKQGRFVKTFQLALGLSVATVRNTRTDNSRGAHTKARTTSPEMDRTGQFVAEISRLVWITQYSEPGSNAKETLDKIQQVAQDDLTNIFKARIFATGMRLVRLCGLLVESLAEEAKETIGHIYYSVTGHTMHPIEYVVFYLLDTADEAPAHIVRDVLGRAADCFRKEFPSCASDTAIIPAETLAFSPYNHVVPSALKGDKPAQESSYVSISDRNSGPVKLGVRGAQNPSGHSLSPEVARMQDMLGDVDPETFTSMMEAMASAGGMATAGGDTETRAKNMAALAKLMQHAENSGKAFRA
jgi:hypothetical protein